MAALITCSLPFVLKQLKDMLNHADNRCIRICCCFFRFDTFDARNSIDIANHSGLALVLRIELIYVNYNSPID